MELTKSQLIQQDFVDNCIFEMLKDITGCPDLEWNIEAIGNVRDAVIEYYYSDEDDEYEFYPWILDSEEVPDDVDEVREEALRGFGDE